MFSPPWCCFFNLFPKSDGFSAYQYTTDVCFIAGAEVLHLPLSALGAPAPTSIVL